MFASNSGSRQSESPPRPVAKRACDACRQRRVKCDAQQPCDRCIGSCIQCSYLMEPKKRGPHSGRVIDKLRTNPYAPRTDRRQSITSAGSSHSTRGSRSTPSPRTTISSSTTFDTSSETNALVATCLRSFFSRLYDLNPTVDPDDVIIRFTLGQHLHDPRLGALVLALSAMVMLLPNRPCLPPHISADSLYKQAFQQHSAWVGFEPSLDGMATSMMLGAFSMARGDQKSAYLKYKEAVAIAELLDLDREAGWEQLEGAQKERALRITSILSGAGRMCSLVQGRSIACRFRPILRSKFPQASIYLYRLHGITSLFEAIDAELMDCMGGLCDGSPACGLDAAKVINVQRQLEAIEPNSSNHEAERVDVLITKRWLQAKVWLVCVTHMILTPPLQELRIEYPLLLSNHTYTAITEASFTALKANGKAMWIKLEAIIATADSVLQLPDPDLTNSGFTNTVEARVAIETTRRLSSRLSLSLWVRDDPAGQPLPVADLLM